MSLQAGATRGLFGFMDMKSVFSRAPELMLIAQLLRRPLEDPLRFQENCVDFFQLRD